MSVESLSLDDEITLEQFEDLRRRPGSDVHVARKIGRTNKFHVYGDCTGPCVELQPKDPSVLYNDMTMCAYCKGRWLRKQ